MAVPDERAVIARPPVGGLVVGQQLVLVAAVEVDQCRARLARLPSGSASGHRQTPIR